MSIRSSVTSTVEVSREAPGVDQRRRQEQQPGLRAYLRVHSQRDPEGSVTEVGRRERRGCFGPRAGCHAVLNEENEFNSSRFAVFQRGESTAELYVNRRPPCVLKEETPWRFADCVWDLPNHPPPSCGMGFGSGRRTLSRRRSVWRSEPDRSGSVLRFGIKTGEYAAPHVFSS